MRFLAGIWQQRMKEKFGIPKTDSTPQQFGQMKCLMNALGDLTRDVIEWMLDPNWFGFCQQVRAELKVHFVEDYPEVGFLLRYRGIALRVMQSKLQGSPGWADFIQRLEKKNFEQYRNLALVYAAGNPDKLARIAAAKTSQQMETLWGEFIEDEEAKSA
jgi:hypothetical protein